MLQSRHFKLIGCEVLARELCFAAARSPHQVDVEFLPKALHDLGGKAMRSRLQEAVDHCGGKTYDAVLLGYALCGNGTAGLRAGAAPLVVPRAHDCIALLMGSARHFQQFFENNPGVYYRSIGWLERARDSQQLLHGGLEVNQELLAEKYGEENAQYLYEELTRHRRQYRKLAYIRTGLERDDRFEQEARREAEAKGWEFELVAGDLGWLQRLADGEWSDDEFLIVPPGWEIAPAYDQRIICAVKRGG